MKQNPPAKETLIETFHKNLVKDGVPVKRCDVLLNYREIDGKMIKCWWFTVELLGMAGHTKRCIESFLDEAILISNEVFKAEVQGIYDAFVLRYYESVK